MTRPCKCASGDKSRLSSINNSDHNDVTSREPRIPERSVHLRDASRSFTRREPSILSLAPYSLARRSLTHTSLVPLPSTLAPARPSLPLAPRSPLFPSLALFVHPPPLVHTHVCGAPLFTHVLAHARFARRYAHFESTIPNSPSIQPHESALVEISLTYDDQAQQLECQVLPLGRSSTSRGEI